MRFKLVFFTAILLCVHAIGSLIGSAMFYLDQPNATVMFLASGASITATISKMQGFIKAEITTMFD